MQLDYHVWRTSDGRHVPHGHRDAAFLAYPAGDNVPDDVLAEIQGDAKPKRGRRPADKARAVPADKSAAGGEQAKASGLTINRLPRGGSTEG